MVRHHILVGLGFKKQNFRNRAIHFMMQNKKGSEKYNIKNNMKNILLNFFPNPA
jgi:hypothetical protein